MFDWLPQGKIIEFHLFGPNLYHNKLTVSDLNATQVEFPITSLIEVSGRVVDALGQPMSGIVVRNMPWQRHAVTDSQGRYTMRVAPNGAYYLEAWDSKKLLKGSSGWFETTTKGPVVDIDFVMQPTARIFGRITWADDGSPASRICATLVVVSGIVLYLSSKTRRSRR